jgi:hypothetical protein
MTPDVALLWGAQVSVASSTGAVQQATCMRARQWAWRGPAQPQTSVVAYEHACGSVAEFCNCPIHVLIFDYTWCPAGTSVARHPLMCSTVQ